MRLSDLIIEHGPVQPHTLHHAQLVAAMFRSDGFNELREELLAARKADEARERFTVEAIGDYLGEAEIWLRCTRGGCGWMAQIDGEITLAELNRRAGEHAEVCR